LFEAFRGGTGVGTQNCESAAKVGRAKWVFTKVEYLSLCATKPLAEMKESLAEQTKRLIEAVKGVE